MNLPKFKFSPNTFDLDLFDHEDGVYSICSKKRNLKYKSSFYSVDVPDYICPWCIAEGSAADKFDGEFNDFLGIEGVSPNPHACTATVPHELLLEMCTRTPSYSSWQQ